MESFLAMMKMNNYIAYVALMFATQMGRATVAYNAKDAAADAKQQSGTAKEARQ